MAVYDKIQRSLLGKCCLPSRGTALTQALQSISGKVPCPKGEQIVNGGFEDGLNNWDHDLGAWLFGWGHSGEDSCELDEAEGWIEQTLSSEVPVDCVDTFECWFYPERFSCCNHFKVIVTYTDDSTGEHLFDEYFYDDEWHLLDLKPYLTAGKIIKKIRFEESNGFSAVDDVSMVCT